MIKRGQSQRIGNSGELCKPVGELTGLELESAALRAELLASSCDLQQAKQQILELKVRRADLTARLAEREHWIADLQGSWAWRLMKPLWKVHRHFAKKRSTPVPPKSTGKVVFALDAAEETQPSATSFTITGWCYAHGGREVVGVRAKIGSQSYFARYGLDRSDVADLNSFHGARCETGFSVTVPLTPDARVARLEAIAQGEAWRFFGECPLPKADQPALSVVDANEVRTSD